MAYSSRIRVVHMQIEITPSRYGSHCSKQIIVNYFECRSIRPCMPTHANTWLWTLPSLRGFVIVMYFQGLQVSTHSPRNILAPSGSDGFQFSSCEFHLKGRYTTLQKIHMMQFRQHHCTIHGLPTQSFGTDTQQKRERRRRNKPLVLL